MKKWVFTETLHPLVTRSVPNRVPSCATGRHLLQHLTIINTYTHSPGLEQFPFLSLQPSRQIAERKKRRKPRTVRSTVHFCFLTQCIKYYISQLSNREKKEPVRRTLNTPKVKSIGAEMPHNEGLTMAVNLRVDGARGLNPPSSEPGLVCLRRSGSSVSGGLPVSGAPVYLGTDARSQ